MFVFTNCQPSYQADLFALGSAADTTAALCPHADLPQRQLESSLFSCGFFPMHHGTGTGSGALLPLASSRNGSSRPKIVLGESIIVSQAFRQKPLSLSTML